MSNKHLNPQIIQSKGNKFQVGLFVFKQGVTKQEILSIIPVSLNKSSIFYNSYRHQSKQLSEITKILPHCSEWHQSFMQVQAACDDRKIKLINNISNVKMQWLYVLILTDCFIESIEPLNNLQAPQLDYLKLDNNPIVSIKSLRKCNFPKLSRLSLTNTNDPFHLSQMNCKQLCNLHLVNYQKLTRNYQFSNAQWFIKLQSPKMIRFTKLHSNIDGNIKNLQRIFKLRYQKLVFN